jgi:hypothetical protein
MTAEPRTIEIAEATRIVPASAEDIFELLASPAQHALIDGSGTVKGAQRGTPERLSQGARFGMNMRIGAPYKILNEVVEFEKGGGSPGGTSAGTSGATSWSRWVPTPPR